MRKTNRQIFDSLDENAFLKTPEKAVRHFRDLSDFPDALGFDDVSGGYLVIHREHSPSAFHQEIPACVFLKNMGFRVCLLAEKGDVRSADMMLNDWIF